MDLLKSMLEKDSDKRISSADALMHPAFCNVLSKSPLHMKPKDELNGELKALTSINAEQKQKKKAPEVVGIPDDINDFYSPNTPALNNKKNKLIDLSKSPKARPRKK